VRVVVGTYTDLLALIALLEEEHASLHVVEVFFGTPLLDFFWSLHRLVSHMSCKHQQVPGRIVAEHST